MFMLLLNRCKMIHSYKNSHRTGRKEKKPIFPRVFLACTSWRCCNRLNPSGVSTCFELIELDRSFTWFSLQVVKIGQIQWEIPHVGHFFLVNLSSPAIPINRMQFLLTPVSYSKSLVFVTDKVKICVISLIMKKKMTTI